MPRTEEEIKDILSDALGQIAGELWDKKEAAVIVEKYAQDITEQQMLAMAAATEDKRREHKRNIEHLLETVRSKATMRYIRISDTNGQVLSAAMRAIISLLVHAVLVS